jgi:osmotically-inducible protein OsmY
MGAIAVRRGLPQGPTNDHDVEELLYDAMELLPGSSDVEVRCESGRVTLTGNVPHKRIKRDVGELAWAIPAITDVQNTVTITGRRRSRPFGRENEQQQAAQSRKQS